MRVLVLGARGMLGSDLVALAPKTISLRSMGRSELDLRDRARLTTVLDELDPHCVINASAYTAVDRAESERDEAFAVNAIAVEWLAGACAERGIRVVHFSTDYVFSGDRTQPYVEDDPVSPLNTYGASKLAGERALLSLLPSALVLRTQWLFGLSGKSFPRTMWERATGGIATRVVNDQVGRPTYTVDVADTVWRLVEQQAEGIVHITNSGSTTWFGLAERIFAAAGARAMLQECTTADYPTPARRPAFSVLATGRVESLLERSLPSWEDALDRFLAQLRSPGPMPF